MVSIYPAEAIAPTRRHLLGTTFRLGRSRQSFTLPFGVRMRIWALATGTRPHPRTNAHSQSKPSKRTVEAESRCTILRRRDRVRMRRSTGGGRERLREGRVTISGACTRSRSSSSQRLVLLEPNLLHPPIFLLTAAILIINNIITQKPIVVWLLLWSGSSGPLAISISITCPPSKPSSETSTISHADNDNIIRGE